MSCIYNLNNIAASCDTNMGGLKGLFVFNYGEAYIDTYDSDGGPANVVLPDFSDKSIFYFNSGSNSTLTSTVNVDKNNASRYVQTDAQFMFPIQDTDKAKAINELIQKDLTVLVVDNNNRLYWLGLSEPVYISAGTAQTGTARGDGNYYQVTFTDIAPDYPPVDDAGRGPYDNWMDELAG